MSKIETDGYLGSFRRRLEGIYRFSEKLVETESWDTLSKQALQIIIDHFDYQYVAVLLTQDEHLKLSQHDSRFPLATLEIERGVKIAMGDGITGTAALQEQTIHVDDVSMDDRFIQTHAEIRSEIAVPILSNDHVYGVLNIESSTPSAFDEQDRLLLETLAWQMGLALQSLERQQRLALALNEQTWLHRFVQALNEATELDALLHMILEHAIDRLGPEAQAGSVLVLDQCDRTYKFQIAITRDLNALARFSFHESDVKQNPVLEQMVNSHEPIVFTQDRVREVMPKVVQHLEDIGGTIPRSSIMLPIHDTDSNEAMAVFTIENFDVAGVFSQADAAALKELEPEITAAVLRAQEREQLHQQAIHDPLTQAYNRRYLMRLLQQEQARAQRSSRSLSLVMVDIDVFHEINDRFGHREGDRVLQGLAGRLQATVREVDAVVRYGGDEFLVVMPEAGPDEARTLCVRLEASLQETDFGLPRAVEISMGTSTWHPEANKGVDEVLEEADHWMYRRK